MVDTPQPTRQETARLADRLWLTNALGAPPIDDALVVELARDEIAAPRLRLTSDRLKAHPHRVDPPLISDRALGATKKFGVKSVSILGVKR